MAKYSAEFKCKVVQEYLNGHIGYTALTKKYDIPSLKCIQEWVGKYRRMGKDGLQRSRKNETYSFQFKVNAVELYLSTEISYQELALQLNLKSAGLLANWVRRYRAVGIEGLKPQRKGRRPKVPDKASITPECNMNQDEKLKQLEEENLKLRIEVAYLKGLRRLRLEQEAQKRKQGSPTVSEDHSN